MKNFKKLILPSVVVWIVSGIFAWLTCGWLFNWVYKIEPTYIWKMESAMMSASNIIWSSIVGLIIAFIFVFVYSFIHKGLPYEGAKRGIVYGLIIWAVSGFSGMITMPFYTVIAVGVIVYWIIQALILSLINGAIIGVLYDRKKK